MKRNEKHLKAAVSVRFEFVSAAIKIVKNLHMLRRKSYRCNKMGIQYFKLKCLQPLKYYEFNSKAIIFLYFSSNN